MSDRETIAEVMKATRIAILTYEDEQGRLVSTPMGTQDFDDPATVWFITEADSDKVAAISRQPRVNVSYASDKGWVSLSGTASLNQDRAKLEELWDPSASAFMQGGPDDPNSALLEVSGDTAQLWESPGKLGMLVQVAKGALGKEDPAKDSDAPVVDL
ncbi:pyridoxamine 5'-phosphate oxidase family protein [Nostocoides australiense]|uniref:General stress protein n=1 Tax=Nostocoides australiense Ben110 TaxID=1193182 RepID=W6K0M6_9MICO|nr:pyridoxamine 5'-phosphate oxidase family protein [Tetrasphaera australiensis]CCH75418.1 General stress protein [Tetrasphaera australiensis Ben110]HPF80169.1 pyridoxamine 5'-phosphate oxidase family protein [Tetrasphaera australiensis]HRW02075.1 pyridoxamine 5'-phosphate oxidase family protein [Tetrasphaera sp.]